MIITREIISIGKEDELYLSKKDLIGKEVEFDPADTTHHGGGYREGFFRLDGKVIYFAYVKVKKVKK